LTHLPSAEGRPTASPQSGRAASGVYTPTGARFEVRGLPRRPLQDLYHLLMAGGWPQLIGLCLIGYVGLNALFATLYSLQPGCITNARPGSFGDAFWFSVQTFATIGFGVMSPATAYAHVLVTLESFLGLFSLALGTGIVFAKFSKPTARIGFSDVVIVTRHDARPCLSFRAAHQRRGSLIDVHARLSVLVDETTAEGATLRRAYELSLERSRMPILALAWTVFHILDDSSPLAGLSPQSAPDKLVALIVHLTGVDETTLETLHARRVYNVEALRFDVRFVDMIDRSQPDRLIVDHSRLSQTTALDAQ
jgi:inward rectifier potassium channel